MSKVKISKEVVEQIESLKKVLHSNREIIETHRSALRNGGWGGSRSVLNSIDVGMMQQVLRLDYEIVEPSGKITKFSDIRLGMLVKPLKDRLPSGIIEVIDDEDESFRFTYGHYSHWGWGWELGIDWEIIDTALELPIEDIESEVVATTEGNDTTDLKPNDYRSMIDIALMTRDEDWLKDILQKISGDVAK